MFASGVLSSWVTEDTKRDRISDNFTPRSTALCVSMRLIPQRTSAKLVAINVVSTRRPADNNMGSREALIRMSLRELLPRLPAERFWQIHRGTVVRADAVATATRDDSGKVFLTLRQRPERLVASRLYAHLFRAM